MSTTKVTLWEQAGIERDTVARRRSNTSERTANITAKEIEGGVTLETLLSLNVPVYRYGTQITIHGNLPDFDNQYAGGYKSLVKNGNGSIGVRYAGIDGKKKNILAQVASLFEDNYHVERDSRGFSVVKKCAGPKEAQEEAARIDTSLFYGTARAIRVDTMCFGSAFYAVADIDAIPAKNLWELAAFFFACPSESAFNDRIEAELLKQAQESAKYQAERALSLANEAEKVRRMEETCKEYAKTLTNKRRLDRLPLDTGKSFVYVAFKGGPVLRKVTFRKVFGKLCYASCEGDADLPKGVKFADFAYKQAYFTGKVEAGLVFAA